MELAETERRFDVVDPDRQIAAAALRPIGLVPDEPPLGADRTLAPHHDDAARSIELLLDVLAPLRPGGDLRVPPDAEPVGLERLHERRHPGPILGLVGHEDVAHPNPRAAACAARRYYPN